MDSGITELHIKNMVCRHCIEVVARILHDLGLEARGISLGLASVCGQPDDGQLARLASRLHDEGFELLTDAESRLVERTKQLVLHHVREERGRPHNLSECLERNLNVSYDTASRIFSQHEGRTIEKYHIAQKIELVKELLQHDSYTLSEIADRLGYSSVAHLSRQFKSVTGMTPTQYLRGPRERRNLCDI